jgi:uncharacterized protein (TIGR03435 family)
MTTTDMDLVREYAISHSENAFAELASRHTGLVYSAALRQVRNPQLAEEVTQVVFTILARKAGSLDAKTVLPGWLYRTACYASASVLKRELRRQRREQEAYMESTLHEIETEAAWEQFSPLLDEAMLRLGQTERDALVLRYFEGRSLNEVGVALGASEEAAKKRVARALEKLRKFFAGRGVVSTTIIIAGAISAKSVQDAPAACTKAATTVALAKGAVAATSTEAVINGVLKLMAWTKIKAAATVTIVALLATSTVTIAVKKIKEQRDDESWRVLMFDKEVLDRATPQVKILPAKFSESGGFGSSGNAWMGNGVSLDKIIVSAYHERPTRVHFSTEIPKGSFDYIAKLLLGSRPDDVFRALQKEIKEQFGLIGRREMREVDVLFLKVKTPNSQGLILNTGKGIRNTQHPSPGELILLNQPLDGLAGHLEYHLNVPVINKTDLTNKFDIHLKWKQSDWSTDTNAFKQSITDQLGLELMPGRERIEMLVIEPAKSSQQR